MPSLNNKAALEKYLKTKLTPYIEVALEENVTPAVADVMGMKYEEKVASVYNPRIYERRGFDSGLADPDNIVGTTSGTTLTVENVTPFNQVYPTNNQGSGLAGLVEYGDGYGGHNYDYPTLDGAYMEPRPFIQATRDALADGRIVKIALKNGLRKLGLSVE